MTNPTLKRLFPLIVSIGAGLLAVALLQIYLKKERNKMDEAEKLFAVAMINTDLPAGTTIEESFFEKKEIPKKYFHEKEVLFSDLSQVMGQPLRYPVKNGETLLWTGISGKRDNALSTLLEKGKRALTLGVDEITSVSGLIQPGDHVDILGTFFVGSLQKEGFSLNQGEATVMLQQNVLVLAVGTELHLRKNGNGDENNGYSGLTVAVTPEEAGHLILAQNRGKLMLILRHFGDTEVISDIPRVTYDEIRLGKEVRYLSKERNQKIIEIPLENSKKRK
ncbi:MAG: Flp pilus assembly protein CpaB [Nitrospirae bacterium]|nr:Flp pilus assembly protein CpaB [Nitrospirota bacterium]